MLIVVFATRDTSTDQELSARISELASKLSEQSSKISELSTELSKYNNKTVVRFEATRNANNYKYD